MMSQPLVFLTLNLYLDENRVPHAAATPPLYEEYADPMGDLFHRRLLENVQAFEVELVNPRETVRGRWTGIGKTAGGMVWYREGQIEAMTVFLSGVSVHDDAMAMMPFLDQSKPPLVDYFRRTLTSRPAMVTVYASRNAAEKAEEHGMIFTGSMVLGGTLFGQLGVGS